MCRQVNSRWSCCGLAREPKMLYCPGGFCGNIVNVEDRSRHFDRHNCHNGHTAQAPAYLPLHALPYQPAQVPVDTRQHGGYGIAHHHENAARRLVEGRHGQAERHSQIRPPRDPRDLLSVALQSRHPERNRVRHQHSHYQQPPARHIRREEDREARDRRLSDAYRRLEERRLELHGSRLRQEQGDPYQEDSYRRLEERRNETYRSSHQGQGHHGEHRRGYGTDHDRDRSPRDPSDKNSSRYWRRK